MNKILSQALKKAVSEYSPEVKEVSKVNRPDLFSLSTETELFQNEKGIIIKIDRSKDANLTDFGKATLKDRYLGHNESFQDLFARVASSYADDNLHAQRIYNYISNLWFMPATPVLSNGGTKRGLPISCFLNEASDSLGGILDLWSENVWLAAKGGGIGSYWGNLRSIGEKIGKVGKTSGIIPFIKVMDSLTMAISQGSLRRGSAACYLPVDHPEIEEFIEMRRPTGGDPNRKALNLHHGVLLSDAFMRAVENDEQWGLKSPADDGVKPQTVESIKHAKAANVPIVVAINKCDLPDADPQKIKNQLLEYELIAEDLSGDTLMVEISATTKLNLDKLVEAIILQAEILDLKTDFESKATGIVLESKIDVGRGPVATIIVTTGTLKKGDFFVSGLKWGKVRAIIDDKGKNINEAPPSAPVEILGINGAAKSGDDFLVVDNEKEAKTLSENRAQESKDAKNPLTFATQDSAFSDNSAEELNLIIKSDVHGSSEAIKNAISQIKHDEVKPKIILADIGMVTETDVTLAKASNAVLIAFNVKPSKEAKKLAENEKIKISSYNIIYEVLDYIKQKMSGLLSPDIQETVIGTAQILEIFKVSGAGKVAGSKVMEGEITTASDVRIIRDGAIIYTGKVGTLFREKNQVKQVSNGQECGITVKDYMDFQKNDTIEAFSVTSTDRMI
ncbi:translation initiation factor IF-2 [Candidatus Pelagibacter sp.]|nr:translation initiation factor IF-2 [Candidatus Pelagibacter sp.]